MTAILFPSATGQIEHRVLYRKSKIGECIYTAVCQWDIFIITYSKPTLGYDFKLSLHLSVIYYSRYIAFKTTCKGRQRD